MSAQRTTGSLLLSRESLGYLSNVRMENNILYSLNDYKKRHSLMIFKSVKKTTTHKITEG